MSRILALVPLLAFTTTPALAQSYAAAGISFGDNTSEETALLRYDLPEADTSLRAQYTGLQTPEISLSATYDTSFGVYVGAGAVFGVSANSGILTETKDTAAFAQLGYERKLNGTVVGLDYKHALGTEDYALTGFVGLSF